MTSRRVFAALLGRARRSLGQWQPWQARLGLLGVAGGLTLLLQALLPNVFSGVEQQLGSLGWRLAPDTAPEERISIVAIDEKSLAEVGPWPWSRQTMARLATALQQAGVQLQAYDIAFPEAREGDDAFAAALAGTSAVLAQVPDLLNPGQITQTGQLGSPLTGVACSNAAATASFTGNTAALAGVAAGHATPIVDADGAVRRVPAYICVEGQPYPALALSALLAATRAGSWDAERSAGTGLWQSASELRFAAYPGLAIPLDADGNFRVSFRQVPEAYRAISAADVLAGRVDPELLANSWVLVGFTAFGMNDVVPTPFNGAAHGVELQARILASVLDASVPYTPRGAPLLLALLCAGFAALLWALAVARERLGNYGLAAGALLLPALALYVHMQVLAQSPLWLGWLAPALFGFLAGSLLLLQEYARVRFERARVFGNLSSYLPADVAEAIAFSLPGSSVNAERRNVTLLSADLRNFSAFGEARPPEESAALLHLFFSKSTDIVERCHGRIHEFKGDSLLAVWEGSDASAANHAVEAALLMQSAISEFLPQHPPAGLEPLALGIGIEQGPVLIGSIGSAQRRSHTLLGETVTITLRIQEMTAELAHPVLIGECAARQLADLALVSQGSYLLAGLRNPHILYALPFSALAQANARAESPSLRLVRGGRS